jgi:hypothetical protein
MSGDGSPRSFGQLWHYALVVIGVILSVTAYLVEHRLSSLEHEVDQLQSQISANTATAQSNTALIQRYFDQK